MEEESNHNCEYLIFKCSRSNKNTVMYGCIDRSCPAGYYHSRKIFYFRGIGGFDRGIVCKCLAHFGNDNRENKEVIDEITLEYNHSKHSNTEVIRIPSEHNRDLRSVYEFLKINYEEIAYDIINVFYQFAI